MPETLIETPLQESASEIQMHTLQTKVLTWGVVRRGDCQQTNGRMLFHSDGTGTWSATVLTYKTHTHDYWHAGFSIKGSNGATLFNVGPFTGPAMSDGNPPLPHSWIVQFAFPPDYFNGIASATQNCSC